MNATPISERTREPWPADKGMGAFSKPASQVCESADDAIQACNCPTYRGDFLVKRVQTENRDGWQVWMRRANARGAAFPGDYEFTLDGRRAKKRQAGEGQLFIQGGNNAAQH